jgi:hypothetical protein
MIDELMAKKTTRVMTKEEENTSPKMTNTEKMLARQKIIIADRLARKAARAAK